jgi:hypothetical protein
MDKNLCRRGASRKTEGHTCFLAFLRRLAFGFGLGVGGGSGRGELPCAQGLLLEPYAAADRAMAPSGGGSLVEEGVTAFSHGRPVLRTPRGEK